MAIEPLKQIYSRREGLMVTFRFKAHEPARICFEKDPMTQFQFKVFRSGMRELPIAPMVSRDNRVLFGQRSRVFPLKSGETFTYRLNLKRLLFLDGESWTPADYSVSATFNLCEQREDKLWEASTGRELPIRSAQSARFMIMN